MKAILLTALLTLGFAAYASDLFLEREEFELEACEEPTEEFLYEMLHEGRPPTKWRTVKGKSFEANRSVDVLGVIARTQEESYAIYKGERHTAEDVTFCKKGDNKLKVSHPRGTVTVTRKGKGRNSIINVRWGVFRYNFRLDRYVEK